MRAKIASHVRVPSAKSVLGDSPKHVTSTVSPTDCPVVQCTEDSSATFGNSLFLPGSPVDTERQLCDGKMHFTINDYDSQRNWEIAIRLT